MKRRDFFKVTATTVAAVGAIAIIPKAVLGAPKAAPPMRTVEIYNKGVWTRTPFPKLKQWDIFRMFEPDTGELVDKGTDLEICIITEPPTYVGGKAGWCLQVEGCTVIDNTHPYYDRVMVVGPTGRPVFPVKSVNMRDGTMELYKRGNAVGGSVFGHVEFPTPDPNFTSIWVPTPKHWD